jgi:hypothetical protein
MLAIRGWRQQEARREGTRRVLLADRSGTGATNPFGRSSVRALGATERNLGSRYVRAVNRRLLDIIVLDDTIRCSR